MKTIRFFVVVLLTVLMSVSFSACGGDDDDNGGGGISASIEGKWYLKSEKWYGWKDGQPDMSNVTIDKTYDDYADARIWVLTKEGENLILEQIKGYNDNKYTLEVVGNNEYKKGNDKFVVKVLTSNSLVVDYYDNYYDQDEKHKEYGIYTFMR